MSIHELAHVMQCERAGGFNIFLKQYLLECISFGYTNSPLEIEANEIENKISALAYTL